MANRRICFRFCFSDFVAFCGRQESESGPGAGRVVILNERNGLISPLVRVAYLSRCQGRYQSRCRCQALPCGIEGPFRKVHTESQQPEVLPEVHTGSGDARFEGEYQSMRSAPCASAPSHPLHAMPSRITRNSHRPRASDRTMVATENTSPACRVSQTRWHRHHQQRKLTRMDNKSQTSSGKPNQSGLDLEKTISLRSRRKFFLDIPFYRTH
jgi:hypothetical protein